MKCKPYISQTILPWPYLTVDQQSAVDVKTLVPFQMQQHVTHKLLQKQNVREISRHFGDLILKGQALQITHIICLD